MPALTVWTGLDLPAPGTDLVPALELELGGRRVGIEQDRRAQAAELVDGCQGATHPLLTRAGVPTVAIARAVGARLVADGAAEELESLDVALSRKQDASTAVVPDRSSGCLAVASFDLSQVVVAEQELDSLARSAGCVSGKAGDAGEVGCFVEREQQARREDAALGTRLRRRPPQQRKEEGGEQWPAALGFLGGGDEVERSGLAEQPIEVECTRTAASRDSHPLVSPQR